MEIKFKLPELGENIESGRIAKILVVKGEELKEEQPILELETDKAVIEVSSDARGVIKEYWPKKAIRYGSARRYSF